MAYVKFPGAFGLDAGRKQRHSHHPATPFDGHRESGFAARDTSQWAHEQYTVAKTLWMDTQD